MPKGPIMKTVAFKKVECILPVVPVCDALASLRFYRDVLGFVREWGCEGPNDLGSLGRDGCSIMIRGGVAPNGHVMELWIGVDNVDPIYDACRAHGSEIIHPPRDRHWAREMRVKDPDGHILWFGSDPAPKP